MTADAELITAARNGDRAALSQLVRSTQPKVWRYCHALATTPQDVDDLAQETYVRALRSLHRYHGPAPIEAWLLSIARRVCADSIRSARRRRIIEAHLHHGPPRPNPDLGEYTELTLVVQALPKDLKDAFVLTQIVGTSYEEAAQICTVPIGTIRSRVARARAELQRVLDQATG